MGTDRQSQSMLMLLPFCEVRHAFPASTAGISPNRFALLSLSDKSPQLMDALMHRLRHALFAVFGNDSM
jgi:hypothetical protein